MSVSVWSNKEIFKQTNKKETKQNIEHRYNFYRISFNEQIPVSHKGWAVPGSPATVPYKCSVVDETLWVQRYLAQDNATEYDE